MNTHDPSVSEGVNVASPASQQTVTSHGILAPIFLTMAAPVFMLISPVLSFAALTTSAILSAEELMRETPQQQQTVPEGTDREQLPNTQTAPEVTGTKQPTNMQNKATKTTPPPNNSGLKGYGSIASNPKDPGSKVPGTRRH